VDRIVPDEKYSGMYRVRYADGSLSGMLNLARAKDALTSPRTTSGRCRPNRNFAAGGPEILITVAPHLESAMMGGGLVHRDKFEARLGDRLLCVSATPFLKAARALIAEGADPDATLVLRSAGKDYDAMRARLGVAAARTVSEPSNGAFPQFVPFREFKTRLRHHGGDDLLGSDENPGLTVVETGGQNLAPTSPFTGQDAVTLGEVGP
jgi:hypothetical protein